MKFAVLIGDGMGDYPRDDLKGKTVLEVANTPNMDWIAFQGRGGTAKTIPSAMPPGSDVANMEIMGYDTTLQYTGRAVFEALSIGHHLGDNDIAFRANLVTLEDGVMKDYSAGHITTEDSKELMKLLDDELGSKILLFLPGVSYRNLMIWSGGKDSMVTTPPHDIIGEEYKSYLPEGDGSEEIIEFMERASEILKDAIVNKKRIASGKLPGNSIWLWGQGRKLDIPTIGEKYGLTGAVVSAVDLVKGIGVAAGLTPVFVPGATGYIDTNFRGKAEAALEALNKLDFVYLHVEAPDEAGHNGDTGMKIKAIEDFDREVVGRILDNYRGRDDMAVLVACDHRTPLEKRTHTREPVPFAYCGPGIEKDAMTAYTEKDAEFGSVKMIEGNRLLKLFFGDFIKL